MGTPLRAFALTIALLVLTPLASKALAQTWPTQTVRIVTAAGAGSQSDILARALSDDLAKRWGHDVVIENRPGLAGTASVAKSPADGHTLLLASNGHAMMRSLNANLSFDPIKDFVTITRLAILPGIFVVNPETGPKSLAELIARAKAQPGKLNFASVGLGSASSIGTELLMASAGIKLVHVPHKSIPDAHVSVMRGDTQLFMTFYSAAADLIASGKLRAIAVAGAGRLAALPELPTVQEAGLPGYDYQAWFGFMAPAATPQAVVDKVAADVRAAAGAPEYRDRFAKLGVDISPSTPAEFAALLRSDTERFARIFGHASEGK